MTGAGGVTDTGAQRTVGELLGLAAELQTVSDSPALDVQLLLAHVLGSSRAALLGRPERVVEAVQVQQLQALLARRRLGEPVAYLLGRKAFWDFELTVDARVLIPRPDTELLVEKALACLAGRETEPLQLLDLGTGSGAIAIALARHSKAWQVTATDQSEDCLHLARDNARALEVVNIQFVQADWLAGFAGRRFDLIASNPPYIAADDIHLQRDGLWYEPQQALVAGDHGLASLQRIIAQAAAHLTEGGWLLLEHGYRQGGAVTASLAQAGYREIQGWQDLGGLDRVTAGRHYSLE